MRLQPSRLVSRLVLGLAWFALLASPASAEDVARLEGRPAPALVSGTWFNLPEGKAEVAGGDLLGNVVYVLLATPNSRESHTQALPDIQRLANGYAKIGDVKFLVLFLPDGRARTDTPETVQEIVRRRGLTMPVAWGGWDAAKNPVGTVPWALIVDRRGVVRYSRRAPSADHAAMLLERVRWADRQANPLVGAPFGDVSNIRFAPPARGPLDFSKHELTLVRWWTTACPFCMASLPSLTRLWQRRKNDGLHFVPVYHYKGGQRYDLAGLQAYLKKLGHEGDLATDLHWKKLKEIMGRAGFTKATSVSFLVDRNGIVRWVHPGPRILYSNAAAYAENDADMRGLETVVDALLAKPRPAPKPDGDRVPGR